MNIRLLKRRWYVIVTLIVSIIFFVRYGADSPVFYGDALGYYSYLPSVCIYHNLKDVNVLPSDRKIDGSIIGYFKSREDEFKRSEKGYLVNQYTYGTALMEAPFFAMAHLYEKYTQGMPNGYSDVYAMWIRIGTLVYALLALALIYIILVRYFTPGVAMITLVILFAGTNLFWFTLRQPGMAHVPILFLYALLMYSTIKVYELPRILWFSIIGLCIGVITIIRVPDILCAAIPLLYNVYDKQTLYNRVHWFKQHIPLIVLAIVMFMLPLLPQIAYYKMLTGHYWFYGYKYEYFTWLHPHIIAGLLYSNNGWLAYSPVMVLSVIGMFFFKRIRMWNTPLWTIMPLYIYTIYSWTCFIYINGFGSRPMIHLYALLAIPLAAVVEYVGTAKLLYRVTIYMVVACLILFSMLLSVQNIKGNLISECSNLRFNVQTLFHPKLMYNDLVAFDTDEPQPDEKNVVYIKDIACANMSDSLYAHSEKDGARQYAYHMHTDEEWTPLKAETVYHKDNFAGGQLLKCTGLFMQPIFTGDQYRNVSLVIQIKHGDNNILWKSIRVCNKIGAIDSLNGISAPGLWQCTTNINKWGMVSFFVAIPHHIQDGDVITVSLWNTGHQEMYVRRLCIQAYK